MKNRLTIWLVLLGMLAMVSCSRKTIPAAANPFHSAQVIVYSDCDSLIKEAVKRISSKKDTAKKQNCIGYDKLLLDMSRKLTSVSKENAALKKQLETMPPAPVTVFTGKVKNSFNDIQKNSNNQTEIYNLKRSLLQKSDSMAMLIADNLALNGRVKELQKQKNSTSGDNAPNTTTTAKKHGIAGDGNTQDNRKGSVLAWILLGAGAMWVLQNVVWRWLKNTNPVLKATLFISNILT